MTTRILPQEFLFQENLNPIQVQTVVSKELLDDKMFLPHVKHFNLSAGTVILVQVMNEAKDMLLHEAEFRVIAAVESAHGIVDDYGSKTVAKTQYQVQRWSEWKSSKLAEVEVEPVPEEDPEIYVQAEAIAKWNPGKKTYQIMIGDKVVAEERDKERALAMAAGSEPLAA